MQLIIFLSILVPRSHTNPCVFLFQSWLSSAGVSLATLDNVKATVYNVGLADPRDLKATNLREKKGRATSDLSADPPLSTITLQQTAV